VWKAADYAAMAAERGPFLALMTANAVRQVGSMMTAVAVPWLVLETTSSAAKVGLTGVAIAIGWVAPSVLGGPLVDRLGLRRTSVTTDALGGLAVAGIAILQLLGILQFWQLLVLVFLMSSFNAQGDTARFALIPDLANGASMSLERANSADRGIARAGQLIGPVLGGVLISILGTPEVLLANAAAFIASAFLVTIRVPSADTSPSGSDQPATREKYIAELSEGLRFVVGNRLILSMILLALIGNFFDVPLMSVVLPVYAMEVFDSPTSLGLMVGSFAAGALAGTVLYGAIGRGLSRRKLFLWGWLLTALVVYGALSAQLPLAGIVLAGVVGGIIAGPINPIVETVVHENTPPQLMGRAFGALTAFAQAGIPFGAAIAGIAIEGGGLIPTIAVMGAVYAVVVVLMFANQALRGMDTRAGTTEGAAAEPTATEPPPQARSCPTMKAGL
jgi:MFS family permease